MARPVIEAIRSGDVALAKKLLQTHKYTCIDCQNARNDGTALFWASCRGLLEVVQILLARGANVNARTGYDATPLHAAADANKVHVIRCLLENGADVNCLTVTGDTACHLAAYRGHHDAVQLLVKGGADLSMRNRKHHRPIDEAEKGDFSQIVDFLEETSKQDSQPNDVMDISLLDTISSCNLPLQMSPPRTLVPLPYVEQYVAPPSVTFSHYFPCATLGHANPYPRPETPYVQVHTPSNDLSRSTARTPNNPAQFPSNPARISSSDGVGYWNIPMQ